eukprot:8387654-Prorocentrum_lima.AAC.1
MKVSSLFRTKKAVLRWGKEWGSQPAQPASQLAIRSGPMPFEEQEGGAKGPPKKEGGTALRT